MAAEKLSKSDLVLVAGATGGVGQLTVGQLIEQDIPVRVLTRNRDKAQKMFEGRVDVAISDTLDPATLKPTMEGMTHIICCTGTTAFPSARWGFSAVDNPWDWLQVYTDPEFRQSKAANSPDKIDGEGVMNLVNAAPRSLKRFVFVSSCGILRKDQLPYSLLNAFGVLDAKQRGEQAIQQSGLPYTIVRPGRLIDGPYTSYDLNTLLQAKTKGRLGVVLGTGDLLSGQTSRIDVASACVACLEHQQTEGKVFEIINQGARPKIIDWANLFSSLQT